MKLTVPELTGDQCAWAIRRFAEWVAESRGVWAATIRDARYGTDRIDLHLVVHARIDDEVEPNDEVST
jgi:hypothetical protein